MENQTILKHLGPSDTAPANAPRQVVRSEQAAQIYDLLIKQGIIRESQLSYAKRVHSKLTGHQTLIQVLQDLKFITPEQLQEALASSHLHLKIGALLVELGLVKKSELEIAINFQKESTVKKTIGEILIENGFIAERKLAEILSYQLGLPFYELSRSTLNPNLLRKAPVRWYSQHNFLPVCVKDSKIVVAFADPTNRNDLEAAEKVYGKISPGICAKGDLREIISSLERDMLSAKAKEPDEKSIVGLVDAIIDEAVKSGCSDVHIEPMRDKIRIRNRVDGVMIHFKDVALEMGPPLASRLKIMSKADIAERRRHQGGRILYDHQKTGLNLDIRISFYVTVWGENIVMRMLNSQGQVINLNEIGMYPKIAERYRFDALDVPSGVILITGPTGSGKTTTLYSSINYLDNVNTSILTVEDPVEYLIDGIAQCSIDPKINLTFEESLRHVVRQDPDVIVIGEVRDKFSADTCIQASLTGHKVLSTFHTEDSIGCLIRLLNMDIEPFLISSTVVSVVAQRLLRKVCRHCAEPYLPQPAELYRLGYTLNDIKGTNFKIGRGCSECRFTGYKGRIGVFELLVLNESVKDAVLCKKTSYELRRISTDSSGLVTLLEDGIMKAADGITTIQELYRSLPRVSKPRPIQELRRLLGTEQ